ncbi:MAG: PH domain-containing protein [Defluviitaleaceae bacterium]|nr:PH domain-containing protein [Defluviitaleaceae bacterium]
MFFKSRTQVWIIVFLAVLTVFVGATTISNVIQGNFSWFTIVTLGFFALALVNFILEMIAGGYYFGEEKMTVKTGIMRQNIAYSDIRSINVSQYKMSDVELDMGEKAPTAILVKDVDGFLAELYKHCSHLYPQKEDAQNEI